MKKSNTGILIGVLVVIIALIAVFSFTSSCQGRSYITNDVFEEAIGLSYTTDENTEEVKMSVSGQENAQAIIDADGNLSNRVIVNPKIVQVQFDNYSI